MKNKLKSLSALLAVNAVMVGGQAKADYWVCDKYGRPIEYHVTGPLAPGVSIPAYQTVVMPDGTLRTVPMRVYSTTSAVVVGEGYLVRSPSAFEVIGTAALIGAGVAVGTYVGHRLCDPWWHPHGCYPCRGPVVRAPRGPRHPGPRNVGRHPGLRHRAPRHGGRGPRH